MRVVRPHVCRSGKARKSDSTSERSTEEPADLHILPIQAPHVYHLPTFNSTRVSHECAGTPDARIWSDWMCSAPVRCVRAGGYSGTSWKKRPAPRGSCSPPWPQRQLYLRELTGPGDDSYSSSLFRPRQWFHSAVVCGSRQVISILPPCHPVRHKTISSE